MTGTAPKLKELHRLRRHIKDLESKIEQAPKQLQLQQNKLAKQQDAFKQAQDALKQLALQIREKELAVKTTEQLIARHEKQMDAAANKKEYDTLKSEIAQEKAHISKIEDEILATMSLSEEQAAQLPRVEQATQKAQADFAQYQKDHLERLERFANEKLRAQNELKSVEATLPDDVRGQYNRLIAAKGEDALASVRGKTCSACYTEITVQMLGELQRGVFMLCKNCGRMLYTES